MSGVGSAENGGRAKAVEGRAGAQVDLHELRRREVDRFTTLVLADSGELEAQLGVRERSERQLRPLSRPGVWLLLRFLRLLGQSPVRLLVADDGGEPVGTTMVILLGPWAYVAGVGVREDHRRLGIAKALVRRAEEVGRKAHRSWMVLEVDAANEPARRLYAGLGWGQGATVRWFELPPAPPAQGSAGPRPADRKEVDLARRASMRHLGLELPSGFLHPCEFICRGPGGSHATLAAGPRGAPTLVLRSWAAQEGESGFLLPVTTGEPAHADEPAVLDAGIAELLRQGSRGLFVPLLNDEPRLEALLRGRGGVPKVSSEFWWKGIGAG